MIHLLLTPILTNKYLIKLKLYRFLIGLLKTKFAKLL